MSKDTNPSETDKQFDEKLQNEEMSDLENEQDCEACSDEDWKELPPISFTTLVLSLSTQAMMLMGEIPDAGEGQPKQNLTLARQTIDLLGVLEEKTKGNLTREEDNFLQTSLSDLRIRFVQCCRR